MSDALFVLNGLCIVVAAFRNTHAQTKAHIHTLESLSTATTHASDKASSYQSTLSFFPPRSGRLPAAQQKRIAYLRYG